MAPDGQAKEAGKKGGENYSPTTYGFIISDNGNASVCVCMARGQGFKLYTRQRKETSVCWQCFTDGMGIILFRNLRLQKDNKHVEPR